MPQIINYKNKTPTINSNAFIAAGVVLAGDVTIGANSSVWFNSVLRGDVAPITVGCNTNIQDGTVIHTSRFDGPTHIGDNITIGHMALIHGCTLKSNCFIGMHATVMDKAIVEEWAFVAAGALITPGKVIGAYELWAGSPAKFIRRVSEQEIEFFKDNVDNYKKLANDYRK